MTTQLSILFNFSLNVDTSQATIYAAQHSPLIRSIPPLLFHMYADYAFDSAKSNCFTMKLAGFEYRARSCRNCRQGGIVATGMHPNAILLTSILLTREGIHPNFTKGPLLLRSKRDGDAGQKVLQHPGKNCPLQAKDACYRQSRLPKSIPTSQGSKPKTQTM